MRSEESEGGDLLLLSPHVFVFTKTIFNRFISFKIRKRKSLIVFQQVKRRDCLNDNFLKC